MEWFWETLRKTSEYRNFGVNTLFLSSLGTVFFTCLQGYGVLEQGKRIWKTKSGESVSVTFFNYAMLYFFAFMIYGAERWSIAMTFNGMLGFIHIPIFIGLLKFKGFTKREWLLFALFSLMIPAFLVLGGEPQEIFLMICLFGILVMLGKQTAETIRWTNAGKLAGEPSSLEPRFLVAFMATNAFWFVFGLCVGSWPLAVFNPLAFLFMGTNLWLLKKKPRSV